MSKSSRINVMFKVVVVYWLIITIYTLMSLSFSGLSNFKFIQDLKVLKIKRRTMKCGTFASCGYWYVSWLGTNVKDDWSLDPWNKEMCALSYDLILHTPESIKYNCSVTSINCKQCKYIFET